MKQQMQKLALIEELLRSSDGKLLTESDAQLRENRHVKQLKQFIDEIPGGFFIYRDDEKEEILYANKALLEIFKCDTLKEFFEHTGKSFRGIVLEEDFDAVRKSITDQISGKDGNFEYVEYRIRRKDGVIRRVEDYGHFVRTYSMGNIFYAFILDATERIRRREDEKEELLRDKNMKEQKLKDLIEEYDKERKIIRGEHLQRLEIIEGLSVNYDSIFCVDLEYETIFPYRLSVRFDPLEDKPREEPYGPFISDYIKNFVHPDDRELVTERTELSYIRNKLRQAPTYYMNFRCVHNGETIYLQLRIVNVSKSKEFTKVVMGFKNVDEEILKEIKQKKLLQEALDASKRADVTKNVFLSNISHDIRTPLNAILGFTSLARKNIKSPELMKDYLDKIDTASGQILNIVEKVFEYSYMKSREFSVNEEQCNVIEIIRDVYLEILPWAERKGVAVTLQVEKITHSEVYADKEKIKQILMNIADNAVKFTPSGGHITLTVDEKETNGEHSVFKFIVEDTGVGIDENAIGRIFEPFERETDATHSGEYGSGLGLTIAKHVSDIVGGTIGVESRKGKGSKFTVSVSFKLVPCESVEETVSPEQNLWGKKVLLVEDNPLNREIEMDILQEYGIIVDTAENGKIAVDKVAASKPGDYTLVLMDIQMPVMDGRQATQEIRKLSDPALARIPIIALSANAFESDKRMSIETGINAHLAKPIDVSLIIRTAIRILNDSKL